MSFMQPRPYWTVWRVVKTVVLIALAIYVAIPIIGTAIVMLIANFAVGG